VRPVREQLEHDRVIRLLQARYKRKFEVAINPGNERTLPVGPGPSPWFPDLVLQAPDRGRKVLGVVEVERPRNPFKQAIEANLSLSVVALPELRWPPFI
jgi:hypothetical protein